MPEESHWEAFYDADCIVAKLDCAKERRESIVEFGSRYGTFTLPAARRTSGTIHAFDIEPELVALVRRKAQEEGLAHGRASRPYQASPAIRRPIHAAPRQGGLTPALKTEH